MDDKTTAAPPAPANAAPRARSEEQPKEPAPAAEKMTADGLMAKHLDEVSKLKPEDHPEAHQLVSEFIDGLPTWQRRAVLARFHAHGLRLESRIHPQVFKAALDEALNGRL